MKATLSATPAAMAAVSLFFVASISANEVEIADIDSTPAGQTYGRWAAEWWRWAIEVPNDKNPLLDTTGEFCQERQVGDVWFLSGSFIPGPIERSCEIPSGKSLFFPLLNTAYFAFLSDPEDERTEEFVRTLGSCTEPADIHVTIDGMSIENPNQYFTGPGGSPSPIFYAQFPPGAIFGFTEAEVPELLLNPAAEQGYYLFVEPLQPGDHVIQFLAVGCAFPGFTQDITYYLTVTGDVSDDDDSSED